MNSKFVYMRSVNLVFLFLATAFSAIAQPEVPERRGLHVFDDAKILSANVAQEIEQKLTKFEESTSNQIAIVTLSTLEGKSIEDHSEDIFHKWKLGKENHLGALLLIVSSTHLMHIKVGTGLEETLTLTICNGIIRNELLPNFRRGDYDAGVMAATIGIIDGINGDYESNHGSLTDEVNTMIGYFVLLVLMMVAVAGLRIAGNAAWVLYAFLLPFFVVVPGVVVNWTVGFIMAAGYALLFPMLRVAFNKLGLTEKFTDRKNFTKRQQQNSGWSPSSGWFGVDVQEVSSITEVTNAVKQSKDFTGQGGTFGGGGSSGSW
jgi:uncharacterized protein